MVRDYKMGSLLVMAIRVAPDTVAQATLFCHGQQVEEIDPIDREKRFPAINVPTTRGVRRASEGDYVVKGMNGLVEVIPGPEFEHHYKAV